MLSNDADRRIQRGLRGGHFTSLRVNLGEPKGLADLSGFLLRIKF